MVKKVIIIICLNIICICSVFAKSRDIMFTVDDKEIKDSITLEEGENKIIKVSSKDEIYKYNLGTIRDTKLEVEKVNTFEYKIKARKENIGKPLTFTVMFSSENGKIICQKDLHIIVKEKFNIMKYIFSFWR